MAYLALLAKPDEGSFENVLPRQASGWPYRSVVWTQLNRYRVAEQIVDSHMKNMCGANNQIEGCRTAASFKVVQMGMRGQVKALRHIGLCETLLLTKEAKLRAKETWHKLPHVVGSR